MLIGYQISVQMYRDQIYLPKQYLCRYALYLFIKFATVLVYQKDLKNSMGKIFVFRDFLQRNTYALLSTDLHTPIYSLFTFSWPNGKKSMGLFWT